MPIDFSYLEGVAPQKESAPTQPNTANVTIRVDADSMMLCDGEYIDQQFKAKTLTKIQLPPGQHLLEFLYAEDHDIKIEKEVDFPETGKSYLVLIKGLKDLADAAAEEAKRRAEEEAKRKAAEEAKRKAEEEAKRKAEEEAKRKAEKEAKRKAKEEAKRRAEEEAKRRAEEKAKRRAEEKAKRKVKEEIKKLILEYLDDAVLDEKERSLILCKVQNAGLDVEEFELYMENEVQKAKEEAKRKAGEEIKKQIREYLDDAVLDEKERGVILRKVQNAGLDVEEFELFMDSEVQKAKAEVEAKRKAEEKARARAEARAKRKAEAEANHKAKEVKLLKGENGTINGHDYVDLGLPSGLKWATCNVGANSPEEYGDYYAWGEVETKSKYTWENCKTFCKWKKDFSGNSTHDVARAKWGPGWQMPTGAEFKELLEYCKWKWIALAGKKGYKVTGPNGNSIFLPAAGHRRESGLYFSEKSGFYRSSTPEEYSLDALRLVINASSYKLKAGEREHGLSVRPVSKPKEDCGDTPLESESLLSKLKSIIYGYKNIN